MAIFGGPPQQERERKRAGRGKGKQPATSVGMKSALRQINERPWHAQIKQDAATSTTDLAEQGSGVGQGQGDGGRGAQGDTRRESTVSPRYSLLSGGESIGCPSSEYCLSYLFLFHTSLIPRRLCSVFVVHCVVVIMEPTCVVTHTRKYACVIGSSSLPGVVMISDLPFSSHVFSNPSQPPTLRASVGVLSFNDRLRHHTPHLPLSHASSTHVTRKNYPPTIHRSIHRFVESGLSSLSPA